MASILLKRNDSQKVKVMAKLTDGTLHTQCNLTKNDIKVFLKPQKVGDPSVPMAVEAFDMPFGTGVGTMTVKTPDVSGRYQLRMLVGNSNPETEVAVLPMDLEVDIHAPFHSVAALDNAYFAYNCPEAVESAVIGPKTLFDYSDAHSRHSAAFDPATLLPITDEALKGAVEVKLQEKYMAKDGSRILSIPGGKRGHTTKRAGFYDPALVIPNALNLPIRTVQAVIIGRGFDANHSILRYTMRTPVGHFDLEVLANNQLTIVKVNGVESVSEFNGLFASPETNSSTDVFGHANIVTLTLENVNAEIRKIKWTLYVNKAQLAANAFATGEAILEADPATPFTTGMTGETGLRVLAPAMSTQGNETSFTNFIGYSDVKTPEFIHTSIVGWGDRVRSVVAGQAFVLSYAMKDIYNKLKTDITPLTVANIVVKDDQDTAYEVVGFEIVDTPGGQRGRITVKSPATKFGIRKILASVKTGPTTEEAFLTYPEIFINVICHSTIKTIGLNDLEAYFGSDCTPSYTGLSNTISSVVKKSYAIVNTQGSGPNIRFVVDAANESAYIFPKETLVNFTEDATKKVAANRPIAAINMFDPIADPALALPSADFTKLSVRTFSALVHRKSSVNQACAFNIFGFEYGPTDSRKRLFDCEYNEETAEGRVVLKLFGNDYLIADIVVSKTDNVMPANTIHKFDQDCQLMLVTLTIDPVTATTFNWKLYINGLQKAASTAPVTIEADVLTELGTVNPPPAICLGKKEAVVSNFGFAGFGVHSTVKSDLAVAGWAEYLGFTTV